MDTSRTHTDLELFEEAAPDGLRDLADVIRAWPDQDYDSIAKELGAKRGQVSYAIHVANRREGRKLIEAYELTGSYGKGEGYDPTQDPRALQRVTRTVLATGAATIAAAAASAMAKKT